jgi:hypothetical protein
MTYDWVCFHILHPIETLKDSHGHITGFRQSKLLTDTNAWTAVKLQHRQQ